MTGTDLVNGQVMLILPPPSHSMTRLKMEVFFQPQLAVTSKCPLIDACLLFLIK